MSALRRAAGARRTLLGAASLCAAVALIGAGPFPPATTTTLANGSILAIQRSPDTPLVSAAIFLPAGAADQPPARAGIAGVTAAMVLATPVEGAATLAQVAQSLGASLAYTVDQRDTRYSIECASADLPRIVAGLAKALADPDPNAFAHARDDADAAARAAIRDPAQTAYAMIREAAYEGTTYARPDGGDPVTLRALSAADAWTFAALYRHGPGAAAALAGDVTADDSAALTRLLSSFSSIASPSPPQTHAQARDRQIVAHRDVAAPWIAVGFRAPSQSGADFPAMLVIEALLGRGGDVRAFEFGSEWTPPEEFAGGYYQFEAQPGLYVAFFNGVDVDRDVRGLLTGIGRLRGDALPPALLRKAKDAALGDYLTSIATLPDQAWLLGRAALSPRGVALENDLAARIASVSANDVRAAARRYLSTQTVAVLLPNGPGQ